MHSDRSVDSFSEKSNNAPSGQALASRNVENNSEAGVGGSLKDDHVIKASKSSSLRQRQSMKADMGIKLEPAKLGKQERFTRHSQAAPERTARDFAVDYLGDVVFVESQEKSARNKRTNILKPSVVSVEDIVSVPILIEKQPPSKRTEEVPEFSRSGIQAIPSMIPDIEIAAGVTFSERGRSLKGPEFDKRGRCTTNDLYLSN
jgi:hypothetical protein